MPLWLRIALWFIGVSGIIAGIRLKAFALGKACSALARRRFGAAIWEPIETLFQKVLKEGVEEFQRGLDYDNGGTNANNSSRITGSDIAHERRSRRTGWGR